MEERTKFVLESAYQLHTYEHDTERISAFSERKRKVVHSKVNII